MLSFRIVAFIWDSNDAPPSSILSAQAIVQGGLIIPFIEYLQVIRKVRRFHFSAGEHSDLVAAPEGLPGSEVLT